MQSRLSDLVSLLLAEEALYQGLRTVLLEERERMIDLDAEQLGALALRKEMIADEGRILEESRIVLVRELAVAAGLEAERPTLTQLCDALGELADPLRPLRGRLSALIVGVRELAEANRALGADRLDYVRGTLRALGGASAEPVDDSYLPGAAPAPDAPSGRLVHRSA